MQILEKIKTPIFTYRFLVLLLLGSLVYKIYKLDEVANYAAYVAEQAQSEAEEAKNKAEEAKDEAEDAKNEAEEAKNEALKAQSDASLAELRRVY